MNEAEIVFKTVDDTDKIVILKDNKPAYIILKYEQNADLQFNVPVDKAAYTLQQAMKIALSEAQNQMLHASELAEIIYDRKLYIQKNGEKAKANQMRARCEHYPDMFEALSGNYIKLKQF